MKRQALHLIKQKLSNKKLSAAMLIALAQPIIVFPATAYDQDSYLPPEVIPINQTNYNFASASENPSVNNNLATNSSSISNVSAMNNQQQYQTPQEARRAIYDMLSGDKIFPTNGQTSYNENNNSMSNLPNQMPNNQMQSLGQNNSQDFNNPMNTLANNSNASPSQTQTLSGPVNTQPTSQQRTSGGISHLVGVGGGLAGGGMALSGMSSPGGIYSAGLVGASLINYGLRSGLRF